MAFNPLSIVFFITRPLSLFPPGASFPDYNVREYIRRRARDQFRTGVVAESGGASTTFARAAEELQVWRRQAAVYGLYHRPQRSIMEVGEKAGK